jgi:hypothetical protein
VDFSIDVRKNFIEQLKDIYKALITIGRIQRRDEVARNNAMHCLNAAGLDVQGQHRGQRREHRAELQRLLNTLNTTVLERYHRRDFSAVFERYIHA